MSRLHAAACLLVAASSSCAFLPVQGAIVGHSESRVWRKPVLLAAAGGSGDDQARAAAAKKTANDMYLKAAAEVNMGAKVKAVVAGYLLYAAGFALLLVKTLMKHPLVPPSPSSLAWCQSWLATTVVDYYGAAFALCGIIICSEPKLIHGLLWSAGCCFLGTPFCCLYVAARVLRRGSLSALRLRDA